MLCQPLGQDWGEDLGGKRKGKPKSSITKINETLMRYYEMFKMSAVDT